MSDPAESLENISFHYDTSVMLTDAQQWNDLDGKYCTYRKNISLFFYNKLEICNLLSYGLI
jgi:hypothetical protein